MFYEFLSWGQSDEEATMNQNEMNVLINNKLKGKVLYNLIFIMEEHFKLVVYMHD